MQKIPEKYKVLFWDTKPEKISFTKNKRYVIERVLEYGDFSADRWLSKIYSFNEIIDVVKKSRNLTLKTGNLYALKYNLDKKEIACLKTPFTRKQERF